MSGRPAGDTVRQREAVLYLLRARPHTARDFVAAGVLAYAARVRELRRDGYTIKTESLPDGRRFRLVEQKRHEQLELEIGKAGDG